jgi:hypothetical protein
MEGIGNLLSSAWEGLGGLGGALATAAPFFMDPVPNFQQPTILKVNYQ